MSILSSVFYSQPTIKLSKALLGTFLVHDSPEGKVVGKIVETEAYLSRNDPACHASRGITKRNQVMFGPPGHAYIYFVYGMYDMFNIVSAKEGKGEAVLIRALEPIEGIELMMKRRKKTTLKELCNGPAKLVSAFRLSRQKHNAWDLTKEPLYLLSSDSFTTSPSTKRFSIVTTTRIGIREGAELPLRFYLRDSEFVSRR